MHIKSAGDWSQSLCSLAQRSTEIDILADGPYGLAEVHCPLSWQEDPIVSRSDLASKSLLLVAGGVGIVPFADLLHSNLGMWSSVTMIWAVRNQSEFEVLQRSLCMSVKTSGCIQIQVYITQPARDAPLRLENEVSVSEMQFNQNHSHQVRRLGMALKSRLVTGLAPGLVLFFTIKMYDVLITWVDKQSWRENVFKERIALHGSILILAYIVVGLLATFLALLDHTFWKVAKQARWCLQEKGELLQDNHTSAPLQDLQGMHCASQPFLFKEGRPNITAIVSELAHEVTTLSIHACGPSSLLDAVRAAMSRAHASGRKVTLQIEQAEW
jgi:hypothetical protein